MIVPFTYLFAAYLWQLLPARSTLTLARWRFAFICGTLPLGVLASAWSVPRSSAPCSAATCDCGSTVKSAAALAAGSSCLLPVSALVDGIVYRCVASIPGCDMRRVARDADSAIVELVKFLPPRCSPSRAQRP